MILNNHDRLDLMPYVTKNRHDNDMTDHIGVVYVENNTKLSCDEN